MKTKNWIFWLLGLLAIMLIIVQMGHFLAGHFQKTVRGEVVRQGQVTEHMLWVMTERIGHSLLTPSQHIWRDVYQIEYLHSFDHGMAEKAARAALGDFSNTFNHTLPEWVILKNQLEYARAEARKVKKAKKKGKGK